MLDPHISGNPNERPSVSDLLDGITGERFQQWYRERQYRQNIENGQSYFNDAGSVPDPEKHTPSQLLQCHRQLVYRQENAPAERSEPRGIFWFGTRFEEDLLFPFLHQTITDRSEAYVQNSIWIDFTEETAIGEIRIRGSTDPVIVDASAVPILPTEVKTKSSTDNLTEPNRHHRAQVHAYLMGLSQKFDKELTDAIIIYGGREALDVKSFHIEFDETFWSDVVLEWAAEHTQYRLGDELPPANPEYDWECRFCAYRNRCGKGETPHSDYDTKGLLPGVEKYPRENVIEYLEAHPDDSLTPTLAQEYPSLTNVYDVRDWYCSTCDSKFDWQSVDSVTDPLCPKCADSGELSSLSLSKSNNEQESGKPVEASN